MHAIKRRWSSLWSYSTRSDANECKNSVTKLADSCIEIYILYMRSESADIM